MVPTPMLPVQSGAEARVRGRVQNGEYREQAYPNAPLDLVVDHQDMGELAKRIPKLMRPGTTRRDPCRAGERGDTRLVEYLNVAARERGTSSCWWRDRMSPASWLHCPARR